MKYDIWNPSLARRIIHSGGEGSRAIEIRPRSSVDGVELADHVAESLIKRSEADKDNELQLRPHQEQQEQKIPAMKMGIDESKVAVVKGKR